MILCIDIGGTSAKMALMQRDGTITARKNVSTCFDHYETPLLTTVCRGAAAFLAETSASVEGIGVSATGQVDDRRGAVVGTGGNIRNYSGAEIKQTLAQAHHVPVFVLNDANAAALGECYRGAAQGMRCVIMITLGTGVGGGIVLDGQVFGGHRGLAGEIGHMTLNNDGVPCTCQKRGCLERYASVSALRGRIREQTGETLDGRTLFARVAAGDRALSAVLDGWMDDIADGASSLIHIFNPDRLIIGGGVSAQERLLIDPLRRKILARTMPAFREGLTIVPAALGNDAGLYGALKFWLDNEKSEM